MMTIIFIVFILCLFMLCIMDYEPTAVTRMQKVGNTCRAMVFTYDVEVRTYNMYKDSTTKEEKDISILAKIRANSIAYKYNKYILDNSFVWKDNIPSDIRKELPILE